MKLLHTSRLLTAASLLTFAADMHAADLTIAQGSDPVTIDENSTYDAVVVNGDLTVASGVTLTCTSLMVADGISGTATLTVGDGGKVVVTGSSATKIGVGTGRAEIFLGTDAKFTAAGYFNFCYGHDEELSAYSQFKTQALLVVGTNSTVECEGDFCFGHEGSKSKSESAGSTVKAEVRLDKDAVIVAKRINQRNPYVAKIIFNGGRIAKKANDSYGGGFVNLPTSWRSNALVLEGTNGFPIAFHLPDRGSFNSFASFGSAQRRLIMQGDGGFLKTGAGIFPLVNSLSGNNWGSSANLRFLFTGDMKIAEGGFSVATSPTNNVFVAASSTSVPVDIVVKNDAVFDLAGCDVVVNSITADGSGVVTNSAANTATATLAGDNNRNSTLVRAFPDVAIVKQGGAVLSLCGAEVDSVDVQGGTLVLKDRAATGYPFYRFQVDAINTDETNQRVNVNEFALIADDVDVTRPYVTLYHNASGTQTISDPLFLVDGDLSTTYYDLRITSSDAERRARVGITLEYDKCLAVDAYRWAPITTYSHKTDPAAWRVLGGFSTTDLVALDQVTGFRVSDVVDGWNSTNFVFTSTASSAMHIGALTLADGVSIKMEGAQVSCDTLSIGTSGAMHFTGGKSAVKSNLIVAASCSGGSNLGNWSVYLDGDPLDRRVHYENGAVCLIPRGLVIGFR